jgi:26S proteasome regulatory subunit N6
MILDKIFHGVLDQGRGCLLVYDEAGADVSFPQLTLAWSMTLLQNSYGAAIETLEKVGKVVDSLYAKVMNTFDFLPRPSLNL